MNNYLNIENKNVAVIGGTGLIGFEIVKMLNNLNAKPIIIDKDNKIIKKNAKNRTFEDSFFNVDISKYENSREVIKKINKKFGYCSLWVNASYPRTLDWNEKVEDIKIESWRKNIDMHLNSFCYYSKEISHSLSKNGGGSLVNISSIYSIVAPNFENYNKTNLSSPAAYNPIKGGINSFTRYLASYYGHKNVRVNNVLPGGIENKQPKQFMKNYINKTPMKRMALSSEVASAVIFLLSDASSYITGIDLVVDGGYTSL